MKTLLSCCLLLVPLGAVAEDVYITDKLSAGLHQDKSLESPIVKIVNTGERLEVVKKEEKLSFVRDAGGTSGWISNRYLVSTAPGNGTQGALNTRAVTLENRLAESKEKIIALEAELKKQGKVMPEDIRELQELKSTYADLQQKFNAQKLENAELQVELTELRNRLGQDADTDALYRQIKRLEGEKKTLEIQLANTLEKYDADAAGNIERLRVGGGIGADFSPGFRNMLIYLLISLVIGLFAGAYLLDLINRRRHGGFRI